MNRNDLDYVEIPVKYSEKKLKILKSDVTKLKGYEPRFCNGKNKYIYIIEDGKSTVNIQSLIYPRKLRKMIRYKDGDIFNLLPSNVEYIDMSNGYKKKGRDYENYTITCAGNIVKFDKEDFNKVKDYTLNYTGRSINCKRYVDGEIETTPLFSILFGNTTTSVLFKNKDKFDFRRSNMEVVKTKVHRSTIDENNENNIKVEGSVCRLVLGSTIHRVRSSFEDAKIIYNYLYREKVGSKEFQIHDTGKSIEEENEFAEKLLKNSKMVVGHNKKATATSRYKGVSKYHRKWMCRFTVKKVKYYEGLFDTEEQAAKAYNKKIVELLGEKAVLNVID